MPTYYRQSDFDEAMVEFGVSITIGANTVLGLVDRTPDEILSGAGAHSVGTRVEVTVKTGALPGIVPGAAVTVDGAALKVRDVQLAGKDGAFTQFSCATEGA
ncbi:MAG: hypothetical protein A2V88_02625 [Elusimicrobia bacterium RBG_16_66_12]|nr:MAG: hypothetical protein A2V88_02625 [Elusimicrobia bacterium RBG_16_66_12]